MSLRSSQGRASERRTSLHLGLANHRGKITAYPCMKPSYPLFFFSLICTNSQLFFLLSFFFFPPRFSPMMTAIIKETFYGCSPTHYQMFRGHSSLYSQPCIHQRKRNKKRKPHRNIHVDWFFILIVHFKVKVEKKKKTIMLCWWFLSKPGSTLKTKNLKHKAFNFSVRIKKHDLCFLWKKAPLYPSNSSHRKLSILWW